MYVRAKQAAEKGLDLIRTPEKHPSGPKSPVVFAALTAQLKSCPFKTASFSAACLARTLQNQLQTVQSTEGKPFN
jgi:hypothetical protein